MSNFKIITEELQSTDILAFTLAVGIIILNAFGKNLEIPDFFLIIIGYYFGDRVGEIKTNVTKT